MRVPAPSSRATPDRGWTARENWAGVRVGLRGRRQGQLEHRCLRDPGGRRSRGEVESAATELRAAGPPRSCQPELAPQACVHLCPPGAPPSPGTRAPLRPGEEDRPAAPRRLGFPPILLSLPRLPAEQAFVLSTCVCYNLLAGGRLASFF